MANEHVLVYALGPAVPMTVADGTAIEKGVLVKLSDPMTVAAVSATKNIVGGVLSGEKILSDGITRGGVYMRGIFKATASGSITVGDALLTDHTGNKLVSAAAVTSLSGLIVVGYSLETATDTQTFLYYLNPQYVNMGSAAGTG